MDKYEKLSKNLRCGLADVGKTDVQQRMLARLDSIVETKTNDVKSVVFTDFVKNFFEYKQSVEIDLHYVINMLKGRGLIYQPIEYFRCKGLYNKLVKTYQNLNDFHVDFYKVYGFSLTKRMEKSTM